MNWRAAGVKVSEFGSLNRKTCSRTTADKPTGAEIKLADQHYITQDEWRQAQTAI